VSTLNSENVKKQRKGRGENRGNGSLFKNGKVSGHFSRNLEEGLLEEKAWLLGF